MQKAAKCHGYQSEPSLESSLEEAIEVIVQQSVARDGNSLGCIVLSKASLPEKVGREGFGGPKRFARIANFDGSRSLNLRTKSQVPVCSA
jgi:hypothetical protein